MMNLAFLRCAAPTARLLSFAAAGLVVVGSSGCSKEPGGQVVAIVGDQEITQQDVRAQATAANITNKAALDAATPVLVQQLVDRTVLSGYAREQKLDRGPEYVARRRQLEETLLAYLALRKLVGNLEPPTSADARTYIAANPLTFADRQRLTMDQVRFKKPPRLQTLQALVRLGSIEAIESKLRSDGVQYTRGAANFDTGAVEPSLAKRIAGLSDGEIFDLTMGETSFISQITGRTAAVSDKSTWEQQALNTLRSKKLNDSVRTKMAALKKSAKIQYDTAYQPKGD